MANNKTCVASKDPLLRSLTYTVRQKYTREDKEVISTISLADHLFDPPSGPIQALLMKIGEMEYVEMAMREHQSPVEKCWHDRKACRTGALSNPQQQRYMQQPSAALAPKEASTPDRAIMALGRAIQLGRSQDGKTYSTCSNSHVCPCTWQPAPAGS